MPTINTTKPTTASHSIIIPPIQSIFRYAVLFTQTIANVTRSVAIAQAIRRS
jgi:hypothetical protein